MTMAVKRRASSSRRNAKSLLMPSLVQIPSEVRATAFHSMEREDLLRALEMFAKNWLAHDGCWLPRCRGRSWDGRRHLSGHSGVAAVRGGRGKPHHDDLQYPAGKRPGGVGKGVGLATVQLDQRPENRMVGRRQTPAAVHGCLPGAGNSQT